MANVEHSSGVAALDQKKNETEQNKRTKLLPRHKNNAYAIISNIVSLASLSALVASIQFSIVNYVESLLLLVLIACCIEWGFVSLLKQVKSRPADYGFVHDLFWAATAPLIAIYAREGFGLSVEESNGSLIYVTASFGLAVIIFPLFSMRNELWEFTALSDLRRICGAVLLNVVLVTFIAFIINRHEGVARTVPLLHFLFLFFPLIGSRICYRYFQPCEAAQKPAAAADARSGLRAPPEHVLLIGVNRLSDFYIQTIDDLGDGSVEVIGLLREDVSKCGGQIRSIPVLGTAKELSNFLHEFDVRGVRTDRIVMCCNWRDLSEAGKQALMECKAERSIRIDQIEDRLESLNELLGFRRPRHDAKSELISLAPKAQGEHASRGNRQAAAAEKAEAASGTVKPQMSGYFRYKRVFDLLVAGCLLVILAPVMAIVALLVSVTIGFPGTFWQKRPGRQGHVFKIYKFRSMLAPFDAHGNRIPEAERITTFCRILRRSRLDELPQLFNILNGDMSLVGPRPLLPIDQPKMAEQRLLIRPGVTGWAQVNGGIDLTPEEKLALDLWYVHHASLALDIKIIYKSIVMVFRGDRKDDDAVGRAMVELANHGSSAA